jgi:hypothetical protein
LQKFIAISILSLFLFSSTELRQLVKIPALVSHFFSHEKDHEESVFDFLTEHYMGDSSGKSHHTSSDKQHGELPFKMHSANVFQVLHFQQYTPEIDNEASVHYASV